MNPNFKEEVLSEKSSSVESETIPKTDEIFKNVIYRRSGSPDSINSLKMNLDRNSKTNLWW